MDKNQDVAVASIVAIMGVAGFITILSQRKQIKELESGLRIQKSVTNVWMNSFRSATKVMNADQLLKLLASNGTDVKFGNIIKNF